MDNLWHVQLLSLESATLLPNRFHPSALNEITAALSGTPAPEDAWEGLTAAFRSIPPETLSERLLDEVLITPPIPAGCVALTEAMKDRDNPPWLSHEVMADRVWLWFCHRLLSEAYPEDYPMPKVAQVDLRLTPLKAGMRPLGKRTAIRERIRTLAACMQASPTLMTSLYRDQSTLDAWVFDTLWGAEITGRTKLTPEEAKTLAADPETLPKVSFVARVWLPHQWLDTPTVDASWTASLS